MISREMWDSNVFCLTGVLQGCCLNIQAEGRTLSISVVLFRNMNGKHDWCTLEEPCTECLSSVSFSPHRVMAEEVLPPTIQKLMKGYNKYLRPFFGGTASSSFLQNKAPTHTHTHTRSLSLFSHAHINTHTHKSYSYARIRTVCHSNTHNSPY